MKLLTLSLCLASILTAEPLQHNDGTAPDAATGGQPAVRPTVFDTNNPAILHQMHMPLPEELRGWWFIADEKRNILLSNVNDRLTQNHAALTKCFDGVEQGISHAQRLVNELESRFLQVDGLVKQFDQFPERIEAELAKIAVDNPILARATLLAALQRNHANFYKQPGARLVRENLHRAASAMDKIAAAQYAEKAQAGLTIACNTNSALRDLSELLIFDDRTLEALVENREKYDQATAGKGPGGKFYNMALLVLSQTMELTHEAGQDALVFARRNQGRAVETLAAAAKLSNSVHPGAGLAADLAFSLLQGRVSPQQLNNLESSPYVPNEIKAIARARNWDALPAALDRMLPPPTIIPLPPTENSPVMTATPGLPRRY